MYIEMSGYNFFKDSYLEYTLKRKIMKEFKIGIISDEHLDFVVKENNIQNPKFKKRIKQYIDNILKPEKADILLSGGDTSHYNEQSKEYFTQMLEYYDVIFIVDGNHDRYLISDSQKHKYNSISDNRVQEMKDWCSTQEQIHFLDGDVINYKGLKIGGYGNWYNLDTLGKIAQWNEVLNDSNLIIDGAEPIRFNYGYGGYSKESQWDTQAHRKYQENNLDKIIKEKCDILLTHIIPVIIPDEHLFSGHVGDGNNLFYMSDDIEKVKQTGAEVLIYGHNHSVKEWDFEDIEFKTNAVGYPQEHYGFDGIKYFTFIKD